MENAIVWTLKVIGQVVVILVLAPFLIPAYGISRLLGSDPFSLDGGGIGFLITAMIAVGLAIAAGFFALGYFL